MTLEETESSGITAGANIKHSPTPRQIYIKLNTEGLFTCSLMHHAQLSTKKSQAMLKDKNKKAQSEETK